MDYRKIITIEPDKRSGQACIRGLRMTVRDVLEYLAAGMTPQEIVDEFPDLTLEDIRACLAYAADRERRRWVVSAAPPTSGGVGSEVPTLQDFRADALNGGGRRG